KKGKMFDSSREAIGEEMESHVPTQEQATTANNDNMGNAGNSIRNMFFTMMTQLFDQFMGN
ncbi:hypothetical protein J1N35_034410, partial [Gossypium stocksii]